MAQLCRLKRFAYDRPRASAALPVVAQPCSSSVPYGASLQLDRHASRHTRQCVACNVDTSTAWKPVCFKHHCTKIGTAVGYRRRLLHRHSVQVLTMCEPITRRQRDRREYLLQQLNEQAELVPLSQARLGFRRANRSAAHLSPRSVALIRYDAENCELASHLRCQLGDTIHATFCLPISVLFLHRSTKSSSLPLVSSDCSLLMPLSLSLSPLLTIFLPASTNLSFASFDATLPASPQGTPPLSLPRVLRPKVAAREVSTFSIHSDYVIPRTSISGLFPQ